MVIETFETCDYYVNKYGVLCRNGIFKVFEVVGVVVLTPETGHITLMIGKSIHKIK